MQSIRGPAVARASTTLNILQQTGASIGTAVLSVLLAVAFVASLALPKRKPVLAGDEQPLPSPI